MIAQFFHTPFLSLYKQINVVQIAKQREGSTRGPTQKISEGEFQNETQYNLEIIKPWFHQIMCLTWWTKYFNPGLGVLFKYDFKVCSRLDRWPFAPSTFSCASSTSDVNRLWGNNCSSMVNMNWQNPLGRVKGMTSNSTWLNTSFLLE